MRDSISRLRDAEEVKDANSKWECGKGKQSVFLGSKNENDLMALESHVKFRFFTFAFVASEVSYLPPFCRLRRTRAKLEGNDFFFVLFFSST